MTGNENDSSSLDPSFRKAVPAGEDRERLVCGHCGFIQYVNPRVVVGSVPIWEDRVLLCRRAIEPRIGYWTLPAGYQELNETTEEGARREAVEEACAQIEIDALLGIYNISHLSQVQIFYRARLLKPDIAPGPESLEVGLFSWEEIPWDELAFPSVHWSLTHYRATRDQDVFAPFRHPTSEETG